MIAVGADTAGTPLPFLFTADTRAWILFEESKPTMTCFPIETRLTCATPVKPPPSKSSSLGTKLEKLDTPSIDTSQEKPFCMMDRRHDTAGMLGRASRAASMESHEEFAINGTVFSMAYIGTLTMFIPSLSKEAAWVAPVSCTGARSTKPGLTPRTLYCTWLPWLPIRIRSPLLRVSDAS